MTDHVAPPSAVGELEICDLCHSSPHAVGCPHHPDYDDDRVAYVSSDNPGERGAASFWVEDTYAAAARDAGLGVDEALREGIAEFQAALKRGELRRVW